MCLYHTRTNLILDDAVFSWTNRSMFSLARFKTCFYSGLVPSNTCLGRWKYRHRHSDVLLRYLHLLLSGSSYKQFHLVYLPWGFLLLRPVDKQQVMTLDYLATHQMHPRTLSQLQMQAQRHSEFSVLNSNVRLVCFAVNTTTNTSYTTTLT